MAPAVAEVLINPAYRETARAIAAAMAALPEVATSVSFLEDVAGRPLHESR